MTIKHKKHHLYDDMSKWARADGFARPVFNVDGFQNRINDIMGLSRDGHPIVRLKWMRDRDCVTEHYVAWDDTGMPTKAELRPKYRAFGVELPNGDICEIPPPRWVLEQRYEPEQIASSWEAERFGIDPLTKRKVMLKGEMPREGWYGHLWTVAGHSKTCCEDALKENMVCWGEYRLPGEKDLKMLREVIARRNADKSINANPHGALDEGTVEELGRRLKEENAILNQEKKDLAREAFIDAIKPHVHRVTDDPSVLKHGKYHFVDKRKWKATEEKK